MLLQKQLALIPREDTFVAANLFPTHNVCLSGKKTEDHFFMKVTLTFHPLNLRVSLLKCLFLLLLLHTYTILVKGSRGRSLDAACQL